MITLQINPELNKDRRQEVLDQLAMDYGLTHDQIREMAIIMFGHALRYASTTPLHSVCFVHWSPCPRPDCECGQFFPTVEASFSLPVRIAPQGSSEGH